jgi:hypothetical protein
MLGGQGAAEVHGQHGGHDHSVLRLPSVSSALQDAFAASSWSEAPRVLPDESFSNVSVAPEPGLDLDRLRGHQRLAHARIASMEAMRCSRRRIRRRVRSRCLMM